MPLKVLQLRELHPMGSRSKRKDGRVVFAGERSLYGARIQAREALPPSFRGGSIDRTLGGCLSGRPDGQAVLGVRSSQTERATTITETTGPVARAIDGDTTDALDGDDS